LNLAAFNPSCGAKPVIASASRAPLAVVVVVQPVMVVPVSASNEPLAMRLNPRKSNVASTSGSSLESRRTSPKTCSRYATLGVWAPVVSNTLLLAAATAAETGTADDEQSAADASA